MQNGKSQGQQEKKKVEISSKWYVYYGKKCKLRIIITKNPIELFSVNIR